MPIHSAPSAAEPAIILFDSPEAATRRTDISGWLSRHGLFFGDGENAERAARYDGCTHRRCDCGAVIPRDLTYCATCSHQRQAANYAALPRVPYTGDPVYSRILHKFFFTAGDLLDHCYDENCQPADLQLITCVPVYARELDPGEYFGDSVDEDGNLPISIAAAFNAFNQAIRAYTEPLSYYPGQQAIDASTLGRIANKPEV